MIREQGHAQLEMCFAEPEPHVGGLATTHNGMTLGSTVSGTPARQEQ